MNRKKYTSSIDAPIKVNQEKKAIAPCLHIIRTGACFEFDQLQAELASVREEAARAEQVYQMSREYVARAKLALAAKDAELHEMRSEEQEMLDRYVVELADNRRLREALHQIAHAPKIAAQFSVGDAQEIAFEALQNKDEGK